MPAPVLQRNPDSLPIPGLRLRPGAPPPPGPRPLRPRSPRNAWASPPHLDGAHMLRAFSVSGNSASNPTQIALKSNLARRRTFLTPP